MQFGEAEEVRQQIRWLRVEEGREGGRKEKCVSRFLAVVEVSFSVDSMCVSCDVMTLPVLSDGSPSLLQTKKHGGSKKQIKYRQVLAEQVSVLSV